MCSFHVLIFITVWQLNVIYTLNIFTMSELCSQFNTVILCFANFSFPLRIFVWMNYRQDTNYKQPDCTRATIISSYYWTEDIYISATSHDDLVHWDWQATIYYLTACHCSRYANYLMSLESLLWPSLTNKINFHCPLAWVLMTKCNLIRKEEMSNDRFLSKIIFI